MRYRSTGRRGDKGLRPALGLNIALDFELLVGAHHGVARDIDLLRERARGREPAVEGQGGDKQTFAAACALVIGFGLAYGSHGDSLIADPCG